MITVRTVDRVLKGDAKVISPDSESKYLLPKVLNLICIIIHIFMKSNIKSHVEDMLL